MHRARGAGARWTWITLVAVGLGVAAGPAQAIEFWDERIQIHGFYETRMSFGYEDFNQKNEIDMYGWLQVLNIEAEAEIAPDGWGPFDMVAAFARVEVKYDCVWNHACGMLPSVDAFGNQPGNLPNRVQTGERLGYAGSQQINDTRPYWFADRQRLNGGLWEDAKAGQRASKSFVYGSTNVGLFGASAGPDGILGDFSDIRNEQGLAGAFAYGQGFTDPTTQLPGDDDAGTYLFNRTSRCKVGNWTMKAANARGFSNRELIWSIDDCRIDPLGFNREIANPFADEANSPFGGDVNPVLLAINLDPGTPASPNPGFGLPLDPNGNGIPDSSALPFRPGPEFAALPKNKTNGNNAAFGAQKGWHSQGIFLPNLAVRRALRADRFDTFDQNFTLNDLQWNRGASQEPLKELREIYVEFEMFESRLWVRGGKQTIVWGKTELFRNQDQWNPVDIAIGPLASLEESRIALWAMRGIWSFYEVGPLEDVRLELAALFDKFEPTDIGRCGEPFVPRLACTKSYGLWVHGENGTGIAGERRPEDPWDNASGTEVGARLEFRWDRFSFAFTDYYGYTDTPYASLLFQYSRNVDPVSGFPRHTETTGVCGRDGTPDEAACLLPGMDPDPTDPTDNGVIANHSINQSLFSWICAGTVGVAPAVDASACAFTLFNSTRLLNPAVPVPFATAFSQVLAGSVTGRSLYNLLVGDTPGNLKINTALNAAFGPGGTISNNTLFAPGSPLVTLPAPGPPAAQAQAGLSSAATPGLQAMFGCGTAYTTVCDLNGVDLANAEASVLLQSFPWFEGTYFNSSWDTANALLPQPGTVDAVLQGDGANAGPPGVEPNIDITGKKNLKKHGLKPGDVATGSVGARYEDDGNGIDDDNDGKLKDLWILPGARYEPANFAAAIGALPPGAVVDPYIQRHFTLYNALEDGSSAGRAHPFTGQLWANEAAMASWNLLMLTAGLGALDGTLNRGTLDRDNPLAIGRCSYRQPQYCSFVSGLAAQARNTHSSIKAGGNSKFGRRNFVWASVGDLALRYEKRNILGFSTDFAEDTTKSSWGVEFTWVEDQFAADNGEIDGLQELDEYNLTVSVDRPTFINFLNANRTFFINSQIFTSYLRGYEKTMLRDGPWTALILVNANTGYFQDRFLVSTAMVYDIRSNSGAFLPSVQYRFTENFSMTLGAAVLTGHWERREMGINQFSATSEVNLNDNVYTENGISPARDLDNFFLRLRYTY